MRRFHLSLSLKAALAFVVLVTPIVATFWFAFRTDQDEFQRLFADHLEVVTQLQQQGLEGYLREGVQRAEDFASGPYLEQGVREIRGGSVQASGRLSEYLRLHRMPLDPAVGAIHLLSPVGLVLTSTDPHAAGRVIQDPSLVMRAFAGPLVQDASEDVFGGLRLVFAAPVRDDDTGEVLAVLVNTVRIEELGRVIESGHRAILGVSERAWKVSTMDVHLVSRQRVLLSDLRPNEGVRLGEAVDLPPVDLCVTSGTGWSGYLSAPWGVDVVLASRCLPGVRWTLIVKVDAAEALAPFARVRRTAATTAGVVGAVIALLFLLFHRRIVNPLRQLEQSADAVAKGRYDVGPLPASWDEIGGLARSFTAMTREIASREVALKDSEARLRAIMDASTTCIYAKDLEGRYLFVNRQYQALFGAKVGGTPFDLFPAHVAERLRENDRRILADGRSHEIEEVVKQGGADRTYVSVKFPLLDVTGKAYAVCGISTDITERSQMEEAIRRSEARLADAQRIAHVGSWEADLALGIATWSDETWRIYGRRPGEFVPTLEVFLTLVPPADRDRVKSEVERAASQATPFEMHHRIQRPDGTQREVLARAEFAFDEAGRPVRMSGTIRDVTEERRAEATLRMLSAAIDQSVSAVFLTDTAGIIEYVNPKFEEMTGWSSAEAVGLTPRFLKSGETSPDTYAAMWRALREGRTWREVLRNRRKDGRIYACNSVISPLWDAAGTITHYLAIHEDITPRLAAEERAAYLASHDETTGLLNRAGFTETVTRVLDALPTPCACALLLLDLDEFKFVNDTYGQNVGDELLVQLTAPLDEATARLGGTHATLGRLGGDEFAVFLAGVGTDEASAAAEVLRQAVDAFRPQGIAASCTASLGVAACQGEGIRMGTLLAQADTALYRAKDQGRNRICLFRPEDRDLETMRSRLVEKARILEALAEGRFEPWFQPILDLRDGRVHHYEALARMRDRDGTVIMPGAFIETAERFGVVGAIDRVIAHKVMQFQADLRRQGGDLSFGMNLSGKDLEDEGLLSFLQARIVETGADPRGLVFEITETAAVRNLARAARFVSALKAMGCRFALDDFGVGFTSFHYLKDLAVDFVKIDGSFIRRLHDNPTDQLFVRAMADVARGMGIQTIAEFVEEPATLDLLRELKVDHAQGYLIGKPSPRLLTTPSQPKSA